MRRIGDSNYFLLSGICLYLALEFSGCASSKSPALPPGIDRSTVPRKTVEVKARRYEFSPEVIRVKAGTLLQLKIQSTEGTHGLSFSGFDIDVRLDKNETQVVELYLPKAGEYGFRCSHICGLGHLGMTGKIIAE